MHLPFTIYRHILEQCFPKYQILLVVVEVANCYFLQSLQPFVWSLYFSGASYKYVIIEGAIGFRSVYINFQTRSKALSLQMLMEVCYRLKIKKK